MERRAALDRSRPQVHHRHAQGPRPGAGLFHRHGHLGRRSRSPGFADGAVRAQSAQSPLCVLLFYLQLRQRHPHRAQAHLGGRGSDLVQKPRLGARPAGRQRPLSLGALRSPAAALGSARGLVGRPNRLPAPAEGRAHHLPAPRRREQVGSAHPRQPDGSVHRLAALQHQDPPRPKPQRHHVVGPPTALRLSGLVAASPRLQQPRAALRRPRHALGRKPRHRPRTTRGHRLARGPASTPFCRSPTSRR